MKQRALWFDDFIEVSVHAFLSISVAFSRLFSERPKQMKIFVGLKPVVTCRVPVGCKDLHVCSHFIFIDQLWES